jgi:peptide/nickel transport system substrate-binding protein
MKKVLASILMAGSLLLGGAAANADKSGGTLSFLVQPEPPTLASYVSTSGPIGLVMPKVYEGLFDYNNDGTMVPILAESYSASADGKTVTFNLRKGVKWHDGKPFTSADVQFTVMDVLKKSAPPRAKLVPRSNKH